MEYVIENYDAFLDVAAEIALARLVLEINFYAAQGAAQQGDEQYLAYLGDLSGSLKRAADYIAELEPDSELLHDSLAPRLQGEYLAAAGRWDDLLAYLDESLAHADADRAGDLRMASRLLGRSPEPEHKALVLQYAREAYELAPDDWQRLQYSSQLIAAGKRPGHKRSWKRRWTAWRAGRRRELSRIAARATGSHHAIVPGISVDRVSTRP